MSRLTERFSNGQAASYWCGDNCKYKHRYCYTDTWNCPALTDILEKLAYYEDLEEQGEYGQWKILIDEYDCEYMHCTSCGENFYPIDEDTVDRTYKYCPNCGAKMEVME